MSARSPLVRVPERIGVVLAVVIDLGHAKGLAERMQLGNRSSVLEYVRHWAGRSRSGFSA